MATTAQTGEPNTSNAAQAVVQERAMFGKALVFLAIAVAGAMAYRFTPLKDWLEPAGETAVWVRQTGLRGAAVFLVVMSALIVVGVPRLLFCPLAGALFGFWGGFGVSIAGTMVSYYAAFRVIRGRRAKTDTAQPMHPRLAFLGGRPGLAAVIVSRMLPVPGMIVTVALAMCNVRTGVYLLGSFVGLVPEAAPLVLLGAGILQAGAEGPIELAVAALLCILVAWLAIHYLVRRFKNANQT